MCEAKEQKLLRQRLGDIPMRPCRKLRNWLRELRYIGAAPSKIVAAVNREYALTNHWCKLAAELWPCNNLRNFLRNAL